MTCRVFREQHAGFLDDVLDEPALLAMHCHLAECGDCAAFDERVRRAQALFHQLPSIEPSADFGMRLQARLREERASAARANLLAGTPVGRGPGLGVFAAAAASVAAVAYLAAMTVAAGAAREPMLPPVVATRVALPPAPPSGPFADPGPTVPDPALLASVSMGMPIWSAALMADEAPLHFANAEYQLTSYGR